MQYQLEVEDKDAYLASTHYIDWQNPMILAKAEELFADCGTELEKIKEVVECHFTTGPYSIFIKVYAKDNLHLMTLLNDRIQHIPGVSETETLISLEQSLNRQIDVQPEAKK